MVLDLSHHRFFERGLGGLDGLKQDLIFSFHIRVIRSIGFIRVQILANPEK